MMNHYQQVDFTTLTFKINKRKKVDFTSCFVSFINN